MGRLDGVAVVEGSAAVVADDEAAMICDRIELGRWDESTLFRNDPPVFPFLSARRVFLVVSFGIILEGSGATAIPGLFRQRDLLFHSSNCPISFVPELLCFPRTPYRPGLVL